MAAPRRGSEKREAKPMMAPSPAALAIAKTAGATV